MDPDPDPGGLKTYGSYGSGSATPAIMLPVAEAVTGLCRWISTCPAARPQPRRSCTASSSSKRRSSGCLSPSPGSGPRREFLATISGTRRIPRFVMFEKCSISSLACTVPKITHFIQIVSICLVPYPLRYGTVPYM